MVRPTFIHTTTNHDHIFSTPFGIGLFVLASAVVVLCANHGRQGSRKKESKLDGMSNNNNMFDHYSLEKDDQYQEKFPPRSPLRSPKQLITTIGNKAMSSLIINHKRSGGGGDGGGGRVVDEGFGEGGLWQKEILMGEKCQPPEFSGVIYYDCDGKQVSEFPPRSPRSPRIAPSPEFTFPAIESQV